jgi:hypothetical protein
MKGQVINMNKKLSLASQRDSEVNRTYEHNGLVSRTQPRPEDDNSEGMKSNLLGKRVMRHFNKNFADRFDKIEKELNRDRRFLIFEKKQSKAYCNFFESLAVELNDKGHGSGDKHQPQNARNTESGKKDSVREGLVRYNTMGPSQFEFEEMKKDSPGYIGKTGVNILEHLNSSEHQRSSRERASLMKGEKQGDPPCFSKRGSVCLNGFRSDELKQEVEKKLSLCKGPSVPDNTMMRRKSNLNLTTLKLNDFNLDNDVLADGYKTNQVNSVSKAMGAKTARDDLKEFATAKRASVRQNTKTPTTVNELPSANTKKQESLKPQPSKERSSLCRKDDSRLSNKANKTHTMEFFMDEVKSRDNKCNKDDPRDFENSFDAESDLLPLQKSKTMISKPSHFIFSPENFVDRKTQKIEKMLGTIHEKEGEIGLLKSQNLVMSVETGGSMSSSSKVHKRRDSKSDESVNAVGTVNSKAAKGFDDLGKSCDSVEVKAEDKKVANRKDLIDAKGSGSAVNRKVKMEMDLELEQFELEEKNKLADDEDLLREHAQRVQKKLKKESRLKWKQNMHSLILKIMSAESKLPSLFLNIKTSEAFMLLESVNVAILKNISNVQSEIAGIKEQYPELAHFTFETLEDDFPFTVSPLSILSLKTVSESELKDVLVCEKLSSDILNVLRVFYFVHFDLPEFVDFGTKGQKQTVIEIEEFYTHNLRNLDKNQKPFRYLDFEDKVKLEQFLKTNNSLFSVVSDMTLKPFLHSLCFYTFEILFYYGMKPFVKFMEKPKARDNNVMHSAYHLNYLISKSGFHNSQLEEFLILKNQFQITKQ